MIAILMMSRKTSQSINKPVHVQLQLQLAHMRCRLLLLHGHAFQLKCPDFDL